MWIILFNALDDYGIKELNAAMTPPNLAEVESIKRKVADEALHGALRIAGLVKVLCKHHMERLITCLTGWCSDIQWISGKIPCFSCLKWIWTSSLSDWTLLSCMWAAFRQVHYLQDWVGPKFRIVSPDWNNIATRTRKRETKLRRCAGFIMRRVQGKVRSAIWRQLHNVKQPPRLLNMVTTTKTKWWAMVVRLITTHHTTIILAFVILPHDFSTACLAQFYEILHEIRVFLNPNSSTLAVLCRCLEIFIRWFMHAVIQILTKITWKQNWSFISPFVARFITTPFMDSLDTHVRRLVFPDFFLSGCQCSVRSTNSGDVTRLCVSKMS